MLFVYSTQLEELDIHYNLDEISRVLWGEMSWFTIFADVSGRKHPGMKCFWYETSWNPQSYSEASFVPGISIWRMSRGDNQSTYHAQVQNGLLSMLHCVQFWIFIFQRIVDEAVRQTYLCSARLWDACVRSLVFNNIKIRLITFWPCLHFISSKF